MNYKNESYVLTVSNFSPIFLWILNGWWSISRNWILYCVTSPCVAIPITATIFFKSTWSQGLWSLKLATQQLGKRFPPGLGGLPPGLGGLPPAPGLPVGNFGRSLEKWTPWALLNSDEALSCESLIAPLSIPRGTGHAIGVEDKIGRYGNALWCWYTSVISHWIINNVYFSLKWGNEQLFKP